MHKCDTVVESVNRTLIVSKLFRIVAYSANALVEANKSIFVRWIWLSNHVMLMVCCHLFDAIFQVNPCTFRVFQVDVVSLSNRRHKWWHFQFCVLAATAVSSSFALIKVICNVIWHLFYATHHNRLLTRSFALVQVLIFIKDDNISSQNSQILAIRY